MILLIQALALPFCCHCAVVALGVLIPARGPVGHRLVHAFEHVPPREGTVKVEHNQDLALDTVGFLGGRHYRVRDVSSEARAFFRQADRPYVMPGAQQRAVRPKHMHVVRVVANIVPAALAHVHANLVWYDPEM